MCLIIMLVCLYPNVRHRYVLIYTHVQVIRDMLSDMGCSGTLPRDENDSIDMMRILQGLTYSLTDRRGETVNHTASLTVICHIYIMTMMRLDCQ